MNGDLHPDSHIIISSGGTTKLSKLLGKGFSPQRIHNWFYRGIPDGVKLKFPEIFLPHLLGKAKRKSHVTQS
jgi:hypothetical protein